MMWRAYGGKSDGQVCGKTSDAEVTMGSIEVECYKCHRMGHKANKCPEIQTFQGNCNLCGKKGHKEENCWFDEKNASKRPAGWRNPNQVSQSQNLPTASTRSINETSNSSVEVLMPGVDVEWMAGIDVELSTGSEVDTMTGSEVDTMTGSEVDTMT